MPGLLSRFSESDRSSAHRTARIAQGFFGVAVLAVAGLAAATFWRGAPAPHSDTLEIPQLPPDPGLLQTSYVAAGLDVKTQDTAARWNLVKNRPEPAARPPAENSGATEQPVPDDTPPPPTGLAERVRFLGVIREPTRLLALISIEGKQRIVAAGETFTMTPDDETQIKVVRVDADEIVLSDGSGEHTIRKAVRSGLAIGQAPDDQPARGASPLMTGGRAGVTPPAGSGMVYPPGVSVNGSTATVMNGGVPTRAGRDAALAEKQRRLEREQAEAEMRDREEKLRETGKEVPTRKEDQR